MPQLDFFCYFNQIFWIYIFFWSSYFIYLIYFLKEVSKTIKLRLKVIALSKKLKNKISPCLIYENVIVYALDSRSRIPF